MTMVQTVPPSFLRGIGKMVWSNSLPLLLIVVVAIFSAIRPESYFSANNAQMIASTNAVLAILGIGRRAAACGGTIRPIDRLSARFGPVALRRNDHLSRRGAAAGGSRRHRDW